MTRRLTWLTCIALAVVAFVAASVACNRQASAILTLEITSEHGVPVPSGTTEYEFSDEVTATVDESLIVDVNTSIVCTGWVGTGSVPATGSTNTLTFNIYVNSTLEWQWAYEYTLRIYNPQNIGSSNPPVGTYRYIEGTRVVGSIPNFVQGYVAAGFTGTGSAPASGTTSYFAIDINEPTTITWEWESAEVTDVLVWGDPSPSLTIYGENKYVQVLYDPITAVPRVFYYEPVQGDLVVAYYNGTVWNNIVIDAAGDSGKNLCATVTPAGVYHIAYYDSLNGQVKYARSTDGFQWTVELVDGLDNSGFGLDMALDENKDPAIAYFATQAQELRYRSRAQGSWQNTEVIATGIDESEFVSISFNPVSLSFIIAYYNGLTDRAYFAAYEDDTWVIRQIPAQFDAGRHIKLQVNSIGQPFFCYQEFSQGGRRDLKLTYYSLGKWYFIPLSTTGNTGYYNNIQFDQYGYPIVYTLDKENSRIRQYAWTGMQWTVQDCATDVAAQPMGLTTDFDGERVLFFFNEDTIHQSKPTEDTGNGGTGGGDDDIGTGSSGCFIATAAFGSYNAGEVRKLTSLRDGVVAASYQGSSLVNLYYSVSPCMADAIRSREAVRSLVSRILCTD